MKFLIVQLPPFSRHLIPPRSKYSPQNPILEHPQSGGKQHLLKTMNEAEVGGEKKEINAISKNSKSASNKTTIVLSMLLLFFKVGFPYSLSSAISAFICINCAVLM
jgi:hypothetical protein